MDGKKEVADLKSHAGGTGNDKQASQVGSPEVQAKVDGTIKDVEKKTGTTVGEPEKQAIYDGIATGAPSAEE
ncbi:hypothetical protein PMZ80_002990 [Knufia obscura]|uniref:Uncharacterized protein n=2 Tax=Knufia TaxID=430999 RepID=A0AAN8EM40_9EURO|nr:hypothetical protein PMZ80_002990 [Knufia obscura]KAK5952425.1 hypothetical protein OHC33_006468 [Knufia fluminis]